MSWPIKRNEIIEVINERGKVELMKKCKRNHLYSANKKGCHICVRESQSAMRATQRILNAQNRSSDNL